MSYFIIKIQYEIWKICILYFNIKWNQINWKSCTMFGPEVSAPGWQLFCSASPIDQQVIHPYREHWPWPRPRKWNPLIKAVFESEKFTHKVFFTLSCQQLGCIGISLTTISFHAVHTPMPYLLQRGQGGFICRLRQNSSLICRCGEQTQSIKKVPETAQTGTHPCYDTTSISQIQHACVLSMSNITLN